jgi:hypothetical protein
VPPPTAAPVPSPTVAPAVASTALPAGAANAVNGTIDSVSGRTLSVATNTGTATVELNEDAQIQGEGQGTLADLQPGLSVGITAHPEGAGITATSIRIFPAALGTPRPGQFPMTGANQGNLMTNSVITSFDGATLSVASAGQTYSFAVPAGTEVLKPVPASLDALSPGTRVLAQVLPGASGSLRATTVTIVGGGRP